MPGIYKKNNLLMRGLQRKYPYDDLEMTLRKPKIIYDYSTLGLPPSVLSAVSKEVRDIVVPNLIKNTPSSSHNDESKDLISNAKLPLSLISKVSLPNTAVDLGNKVAKTLTGVPMGEAAPLIKDLGKVGSAVGKGVGAMSGADLAVTIDDIRNNGGKVSKDNAFRLADDITGVATSIMEFIPVVGPGLSTATQVLETGITGGIKWGMADKEKKKELGVKHLGFSDWAQTGLDSFNVGWMTKDLKQLAKENKQKAAIKKELKKQEKEEWKHMSKKDKAKKFFFG
jgi:hypothetical protein